MKRILIAFFAVLFTQLSGAQTQKYSTFYMQRASLFSKLTITPKDIVLLAIVLPMVLNGMNSFRKSG